MVMANTLWYLAFRRSQRLPALTLLFCNFSSCVGFSDLDESKSSDSLFAKILSFDGPDHHKATEAVVAISERW